MFVCLFVCLFIRGNFSVQVFRNLLLHGDGLDPGPAAALTDTLNELLECAEEFEHEESYKRFLEVGRLVQGLLSEKSYVR